MTLDTIRERLRDRAADAERMGATAPVANILRAVLAELDGVEDVVTQDPGTPDRLLTPSEVAHRLGVTVRYVYQHADAWPFTRRLSRRALRFSDAGLTAHISRRR